MRDFTLKKYQQLLEAILATCYNPLPVVEMLGTETSNAIGLRHDVDRHIHRALEMAMLEHELGIMSTYYFRKKDIIKNPDIIRKITSLGHEIGYHYENLAEMHGDKEKALADFKSTLQQLRLITWIDSISMHGSPLSLHNNLDMWEKNEYRRLGVGYEITLDVLYDKVLYLTDTGRRWDSGNFNRRDNNQNGIKLHNVRTTDQLIDAINQKNLPNRIIINIHPQRWVDNVGLWLWEKVGQGVKNFVKQGLSGFQVIGFSGYRVFRFSGFQVIGLSGFQVIGFSGFQVFRLSGFQVIGFSGFQVIRLSGFQVLTTMITNDNLTT